MSAWDAEFVDGWSKYGPAGTVLSPSGLLNPSMAGDWTGYDVSNGNLSVVAPLMGAGLAAFLVGTNAIGGDAGPWKTLPVNYARCTGTRTFSANLVAGAQCGFQFRDITTPQLTLTIEGNGAIGFRRGGVTGTLVATGGSVASGSVNNLAWDITFHGSAGIVKVWLNGVLISALNLTGQNTAPSGNAYINGIKFSLANLCSMTWQDQYDRFYISSGGTDAPPLTSPTVQTQFPSSDATADFTATAGVLGPVYSVTAVTNAPGANELALRKYTPVVNATINSIGIVPEASNGMAKFKGVIYADSTGVPGSLLSSGTEVTGTVAGTALVLPLVTPQSLTAGTPVWIGYITDTSVVLAQQDNTTVAGFKAANTYASGAPGSAPSMTGSQPSWELWGNCTAMAHNWPQVSTNPPVGDLSYNSDTSVSDFDLFGFPALSGAPVNIYTVAVKGFLRKSDSGARTVNLQTKSGATTSNGSTPGIAPGTSYVWEASYFDVDPNTSAAWANAAAVNAATSGYEIAS